MMGRHTVKRPFKHHLTEDQLAVIARAEAHRRQAREAVTAGVCPLCASKLKRNLSMTGWWQCEQFGAPQFRARANEAACIFSVFV